MNRLAAALAAIAVAELSRHVWHAYNDMCCDIANLDDRLHQIEAPRDIVTYDVPAPIPTSLDTARALRSAMRLAR